MGLQAEGRGFLRLPQAAPSTFGVLRESRRLTYFSLTHLPRPPPLILPFLPLPCNGGGRRVSPGYAGEALGRSPVAGCLVPGTAPCSPAVPELQVAARRSWQDTGRVPERLAVRLSVWDVRVLPSHPSGGLWGAGSSSSLSQASLRPQAESQPSIARPPEDSKLRYQGGPARGAPSPQASVHPSDIY